MISTEIFIPSPYSIIFETCLNIYRIPIFLRIPMLIFQFEYSIIIFVIRYILRNLICQTHKQIYNETLQSKAIITFLMQFTFRSGKDIIRFTLCSSVIPNNNIIRGTARIFVMIFTPLKIKILVTLFHVNCLFSVINALFHARVFFYESIFGKSK